MSNNSPKHKKVNSFLRCIFITFLITCTLAGGHLDASAGACGGQGQLIPMELDLQQVKSLLMSAGN